MLKARKRITKRQIKEDKFVTFYFKAVDFFKKNMNKVTIGLVVVLAVIILVMLFRQSKKTAELNASVQLAKANSEIAHGQYQQTIDILLNMINNYSGTSSASRGVYLLAHTYFQNGEYENAITYFKKYLDDYGGDPILTSGAYSGLGACYEQLGKLSDAAQAYENGATKYAGSFEAPQQLMNAARCYALENRIADAKNCYEKVIEQYPKSDLKSDAELFLAKLNG
jgi:TolA-binding protein